MVRIQVGVFAVIEYLTIYEAHRTDTIKQSVLIRASSIGIARLAARKLFGEGVSFMVREALKEEIEQARKRGEFIVDAEGE